MEDQVAIAFEDLGLRVVRSLWETKAQFDMLREEARQRPEEQPRKGKRRHEKSAWWPCLQLSLAKGRTTEVCCTRSHLLWYNLWYALLEGSGDETLWDMNEMRRILPRVQIKKVMRRLNEGFRSWMMFSVLLSCLVVVWCGAISFSPRFLWLQHCCSHLLYIRVSCIPTSSTHNTVGQCQKWSNSARRPSKIESWVQSWRLPTSAFCDFTMPSL